MRPRLSDYLMLTPLALCLIQAGCERSTGFCQVSADCTSGQQCNTASSTCQAGSPDMAVAPMPHLGTPILAPAGMPGGMPGDSFAYSVAMTDSYAVFGAHLAQGAKGAVYVCDLTPTGCGSLTLLTPPTGMDALAFGDYFGVSVAASGNTIAVGAYNKDGGKGAVFIYVKTGALWNLFGKVVAPGAEAAPLDFFGISVSLSGDTLAVGAHNKGGGAGAAYAFSRTGGTGPFLPATATGRLPPPTGEVALATLDYFGLQVAASLSFIAVGAPGRLMGKGEVYLYRYDAVNKGVQVLTPQPMAGTTPNEQFGGSALALDSAMLAVGSPGYASSPQLTAQGAVFLYDLLAPGTVVMLLAPNPRPRQRLGFSVALAPVLNDAETLLTGAVGREQALVFRRSSTTAWKQTTALDVQPEYSRGAFGAAVTTNGSQHIVGIRSLPQDTGAAFFYPDSTLDK